MPDYLIAAIESSWAARALRTSFIAYPLVNAAHILGAGAVVTTVWLMHRALATSGPFAANALLFRRIAVGALAIMALTGAALFSVKPGEYAANPAFRIKLALIALALANVAVFHFIGPKSAVARRVAATVSVIAWPAVLVAGRFIGFV